MKIFEVDVTAKFIDFEIDGKRYSVLFRDNLFKGVYDISVWVDGNESDAKIKGAYPPLRKWLPDVWRIYAPLWLKSKLRRFRRLHNR